MESKSILEQGTEWEPSMAAAEEMVTEAIQKRMFGLLKKHLENFTIMVVIRPHQQKRKLEIEMETEAESSKKQKKESTCAPNKRRQSEEIKLLFEKKLKMDI